MAKQIKKYTYEITVDGAATTGFVRYEINDSVETALVKSGELTFTVTDGNTVTQEKAAVVTAVETAEGI